MEENKQIISLSERISEVFKVKKMKQKDLVNKYDYLSSPLINKFFNNQKTVTEHLIRLCIDENINLDFLCTGRGNMFVTNESYIKEKKESDLLVTSFNNPSIENTLIEDIKKLSSKRQEYYYHRVKADLIDDEI